MGALRVMIVSAAAFLAAGGVAAAHGPSLETKSTVAVAGEVIELSGEGLSGAGKIEIVLRGVSGDRRLGEVSADRHGRFEAALTLPADLEPGEYLIVAQGERRASVRLAVRGAPQRRESERAEIKPAVGPSGAEAQPHEEHEHEEEEGGHRAEEARRASPEPMKLRHGRTGAERALAWLIVLSFAGAGVALLLPMRRRPEGGAREPE
jgi:hypothetical protein